MTGDLGFRPRRHMTRWLDPLQLASVGWRTQTSRRADRARDHLPDQPAPVGRYADDGDDLWFDYVADLGDAFDPTMAVAWHLGRCSVPLDPDPDGFYPRPPATGVPRGRFVVFGGDHVYPYATRRRYRDQTVGPYSLAFEGEGGADAYAIPGNHDVDGRLGAFRSVFCDGASLGRWRSRQSATWFAVQLPRRWWLWGVDTGLRGDINVRQRDYFAAVASELEPGDRVVLCSAVPMWALYEKRPEELHDFEEFLDGLVGSTASVAVFLAGDSHLFAAFLRDQPGGTQLHLTAGGGGAFLHPTHHLLFDTRRPGSTDFALLRAWPSAGRSRELAQPGLRVAWDRGSRALIPLLALLHLWFSFGWLGVGRWLAVALMVAAGSLAVTPNTRGRLVGRAARRRGALLGLVLAAELVAIAAAAGWAADRWAGGRAWLVAAAVVGAFVSLCTFAIVLARANQAVDVSDNLAFSTRHLRLYKHFVRCRVDGQTGRLDIYVIGIQDPGSNWAGALAATGAPPPSCSEPVYVWGRSVG